jgi:hypothetical protein
MKIDTRFSDPEARPTPWAQTAAALEHANTGGRERKIFSRL